MNHTETEPIAAVCGKQAMSETAACNRILLLDTEPLADADVFSRWYRKMPSVRRQKIDAFRFDKDRRLSLGAGILLHEILRRVDADEGRLSKGENGKPILPDSSLHFNLSHSGRIAACAVSDRPVGVDIEEIRHFDESLIRYVFREEEIVLLRNTDADCTALWTIKESLMKYWGAGITLGPKKICVKPGEPLRAFCEEYPSGELFFTRFAFEEYRLTVCSAYERFCREAAWFDPTAGAE